MNILKKIFDNFKPNDFASHPYGWLTNQGSHVGFSLFLTYCFNFIELYYIVAVFWIVWEVVQLIKSKNVKDFANDLFFELSGVVILFEPLFSIPVVIYLIMGYILRLKD